MATDRMNIHPLAAQVHEAIAMAGARIEPRSDASVPVVTEVERPKNDGKRVSAVDLLTRQPWAIQSDMLETIVSIARRENESPEAVAAKMGRPLQSTRSVSMRDSVAVIPVTGSIFRYANLFSNVSGATSLEALATDFNAALDNPSVSAIVFEFDSPGGQATGIAEFAQMVRAANKPVTAYVSGVAASAAYWIAAAADEVVISRTGEVGSIGAMFGLKIAEDESMVQFISSQSPMKRPDPKSDEGSAELQARVDALAQVFIDDVAQYRGVSVETVLSDFGKGGVRLGEEAVRLGMADRVSTLESVIAGLSGAATQGGSRTMATEQGQPAADKPADIGSLTAADLKDKNPGLYDEVRAEALAEGKQAGAAAERKRIEGVFNTPMAQGHGDLLKTLMFDGETTAEQAALKVLAAEDEARSKTLSDHRADAPKPLEEPTNPGEGGTAAEASFDGLMASYQAEGMSRADATRKIAREHPKVHEAHIHQINGEK